MAEVYSNFAGEFSRVYDLLEVKVDNACGESFYEDKMPTIIKKAQDKIAIKSDGAWIIETGHESPLMLLKSDGGTTYATRDLAAVLYRMNTYDPIKIIYEVEPNRLCTSHSFLWPVASWDW